MTKLIWTNGDSDFDFSNATFRPAPRRSNPERVEIIAVREISSETLRIASWEDRHDANGRLPGETRVWRTRTGNKVHMGYNHSYCGARANIEYLVTSPEDARLLAKDGVLCEKCFGANPDIAVKRLVREAERRQENAGLHRALCVTLAAARRAEARTRRAEAADGTPDDERTAQRAYRAISDAIFIYWDEHGKTREEQEKALMRATRQQEMRLEGMEVKVVTCPVMKQSRDVEVTGPGGNMRQVVGLTWAEAEHLHKLLGAALEAHRTR